MAIAHFWSFDAQCLGLTIDALARRALTVNDVVERAGAVEQGAHQATFLAIDVFDATFALGKLLVVAALAGALRK